MTEEAQILLPPTPKELDAYVQLVKVQNRLLVEQLEPPSFFETFFEPILHVRSRRIQDLTEQVAGKGAVFSEAIVNPEFEQSDGLLSSVHLRPPKRYVFRGIQIDENTGEPMKVYEPKEQVKEII